MYTQTVPQHVIPQILALLAAGWSYRDTARRLGVSVNTVYRARIGRLPAQRAAAALQIAGRPPIPDPWSPRPKSRCPTCGGMCEMPCYGCYIRRQTLNAGRIGPPPPLARRTKPKARWA